MGKSKKEPVVLDPTMRHHWFVVIDRMRHRVQITCADCGMECDYPLKTLPAIELYIRLREDVQLLSWIDSDVN